MKDREKTGLLAICRSQSVGLKAERLDNNSNNEISVQKPAQRSYHLGSPGTKAAVAHGPSAFAGSWKAVTVFCHRTFPNCCLDVIVTQWLVFPGVSETAPFQLKRLEVTDCHH